jgi:hypothetical protein
MVIPAIYNTDFHYESVPAGYTDVQDLIDRMQVILTTVLPAASQWSIITDASTGNGRWRSPTINGRFNDFSLAKSTATLIHVRVFDQNGNNIMPGGLRRMTISGSLEVEFFAGPNYAMVMERLGSNEPFALMNMIDVSGIPGTVNNYTVGHCQSNSAGSLSNDVSLIASWRNGAANHSETVMSPGHDFPGTPRMRTLVGSHVTMAIEVSIQETAATRQGGPLYQCMWVDRGLFPPGSDVIAEIDNGVPATFRVTNIHFVPFQDDILAIAYRKA